MTILKNIINLFERKSNVFLFCRDCIIWGGEQKRGRLLTIQDDVCIMGHDDGFIVGNIVKKIEGGVWIPCFLFRKRGTFDKLMV